MAEHNCIVLKRMVFSRLCYYNSRINFVIEKRCKSIKTTLLLSASAMSVQMKILCVALRGNPRLSETQEI